MPNDPAPVPSPASAPAPAPVPVPWAIRSVLAPLVLLALGVGLFIWSQNYNVTARRFPGAVSFLLALLAVIDLWCRTSLPGAAFMRAFWGADFSRREMTHNPKVTHEIAMVLWTVACVVGMATIGILATAPIFCAAFVIFSAKLSPGVGVLTGALVFAFIYGVFEVILSYTLYRGLFFTTGGMAGW